MDLARRPAQPGGQTALRLVRAGAKRQPQSVFAKDRRASPWWRPGVAGLNLLATVQVVWFYINRVPPYIQLSAYEHGSERVPFQYRLLLMYPMRWAHESGAINRLAHTWNAMPGWFPNGVRPEGLVQAPIDLLSVAVAGVVARRLYQASSKTGVLTPLVYPLTLVMVVGTYCLLTMHLLRFIYDLPSLGFFALGLECIYFRRHGWFCLLFLAATVNRETTLFLLIFFAIAECLSDGRFLWRRLYRAATVRVLLPLSAAWVLWHLYVVHRYAGNPSESLSRVLLNLGVLLLPITWPQIFGAFGYVWPLVILCRREIPDPLLRAWLSVLPCWFLFMFYYGIFLETRVFGELIPWMACVAALIFEERLIQAGVVRVLGQAEATGVGTAERGADGHGNVR